MLNLEEKLMMEAFLLKKDKEYLLPFPTFPLIKTVAKEYLLPLPIFPLIIKP